MSIEIAEYQITVMRQAAPRADAIHELAECRFARWNTRRGTQSRDSHNRNWSSDIGV